MRDTFCGIVKSCRETVAPGNLGRQGGTPAESAELWCVRQTALRIPTAETILLGRVIE
jgi:hypothetical protein